ncbi:MAG: hypothetical protein ACYC25_02915, partial [Paludibacter sp.]
MKQLAILFLFLSAMPLCKAQEEIIFNDINVDKKDIKVEKIMSGIEFNSDIIRLFPGLYMGYLSGSVETHLSYFHENRISNTLTLNKSIGFGNTFYNNIEYISNGTPYGVIAKNGVYQYVLSLDIKMEPRWYFDQRLRYKHNKSTLNNSGWFLSVPLTLSTNLLNQPFGLNYPQWVPEHFIINIIAPPTIGFRNSISKKCFWEISAGYIPLRAWF